MIVIHQLFAAAGSICSWWWQHRERTQCARMQCYQRANGQPKGPTKKAEVEARLLALLGNGAAPAAAAAAVAAPGEAAAVKFSKCVPLAACAAGGGSSLKGSVCRRCSATCVQNGQCGGPTKKAEVEARLLALLAAGQGVGGGAAAAAAGAPGEAAAV